MSFYYRNKWSGTKFVNTIFVETAHRSVQKLNCYVIWLRCEVHSRLSNILKFKTPQLQGNYLYLTQFLANFGQILNSKYWNNESVWVQIYFVVDSRLRFDIIKLIHFLLTTFHVLSGMILRLILKPEILRISVENYCHC